MNDTIKSFFEKLKTNENVLGILLFGSYARGNNRPNSDVDLIVILKDGFERTVEVDNNIAFEITYTTEEGATRFWQDNPDDCVDLWNSGKIIFDRDGTMEKLKTVGLEIKNKGKPSFDDTKIKHLSFDAKDQLEAIKTIVITDMPTANLLLSNKIFQLIELYFDIRKLWKPAPKQFLMTLKELDPSFAKLVSDYYLEKDMGKKLGISEDIIKEVFLI